MKAYLKSNQTFRTLRQYDVLDYDLCTDALSDESSTLTVAGDDVHEGLKDCWAVLEGAVYRIGTVTPGTGTAKLALLSPDTLFSRPLFYTEGEETTVGAFLAAQIMEGWIAQQDSAYALSYLTVTNRDTTPFEPPEADKNGLFSLLDYLREMRRKYNVGLHFALDGARLRVEIRRDTAHRHTLIRDDGHTTLLSSAFAASVVAKITTVQPVDTGETDEDGEKIYTRSVRDWYLAADGSISNQVPETRATGAWELLPVSEQDNAEEKARERFADNTASHKVELRTDRPMAVNDIFRIRIGGEVFEGTVSSVRRKSGEARPLYRAGDLATTLPEKVRSMRKE